MTPNPWRQATEVVVVLVPVLLIAYNVIAYRFGGREATISVVIHSAAARWPEVAFFGGLLAAHWFWGTR